eukprot:2659368-Amphidinium_carterae.1
MLPRNEEVNPRSGVSLALIGNHFAQPRQQLPAWITDVERPSDIFCVSNKQGKRFVFFLTCAASLLAVTALTSKTRLRATLIYARFARARAAWHETSH